MRVITYIFCSIGTKPSFKQSYSPVSTSSSLEADCHVHHFGPDTFNDNQYTVRLGNVKRLMLIGHKKLDVLLEEV